MLELLLILSLVMNIMQFFWLVALAGERRSLHEQIRWLQQQIEQLQREQTAEFGSGGAGGLLIAIVLILIVVVGGALLTRGG